MAIRPIRIMLVAAHPADSFDQAGGTLAHHVAQGDKVTAVIATTGVRSHHWRLAADKLREGNHLDVEARVKDAVAQKLEEVRTACRILGFDDVRDLGFEDDDLALKAASVGGHLQLRAPNRVTLLVGVQTLASLRLPAPKLVGGAHEHDGIAPFGLGPHLDRHVQQRRRVGWLHETEARIRGRVLLREDVEG